MHSLMTAMIVAVATLTGACGTDGQPPADQDSGSQLSEAREMFNAKCARCHGIAGGANGFFSDSLHPRPHNYTSAAWQASVTDDQIREMIVRGGLHMRKSPAMPGFPTLKNRPVLDGLVRLIRGFAKRP